MSPTTVQSREVTAQGPRGGKQKVKVDPVGKDIKVTWICGGARTFSVEELRRDIELVDGPGSRHILWFDMKDVSGRRFWIKLHEGKLTANDSMASNGEVSWSDLKRALQATIAEILTS